MRVKKTADVHLSRTDLDWVVVRPGELWDEPGTGHVEAGLAVPYGGVHATTSPPSSTPQRPAPVR